jgi:membrane-associated phospholipid phosphatase
MRVGPPPDLGSTASRDRADKSSLGGTASAAEIRFWTQHPIDAWFDTAFVAVEASEPKDPPRAARAYSYLSAAIYDAVVVAWYWKGVYRRSPPDGAHAVASEGEFAYPSAVAAVAGAGSRMLEYLFPDMPSPAYELLAAQAARARVAAGVSRLSDVEAGLSLGRRVAAAVIARARSDGASATWNGRVPEGRGVWAPPPGNDESPVEPLAGSWRTWFLTSGSEFRPGPPPPYGSARMLREAREVIEVGAHLTPGERSLARFWRGGQGTPQAPGLWDRVALWYAQRNGLDLPHQTAILAVLNMAMSDAGVAVWDCKYHYWSPRPENVIRDLGLDPTWRPLLPTPLFPSYVSGHSPFSAAAAEVLAWFFPYDGAQIWSEARGAALSRLYGGIHFRSDIEVGFKMGEEIGALAVDWVDGDRFARGSVQLSSWTRPEIPMGPPGASPRWGAE